MRRSADPEATNLPGEYVQEGWDLFGMLSFALASVLLEPKDAGTSVPLLDFLHSVSGEADRVSDDSVIAERDRLLKEIDQAQEDARQALKRLDRTAKALSKLSR